jgi:anti-sigma B factor antagonist
MEATRLEVRVRTHGDVAVVDLRGEIDAGADDALEHAYAEAAEASAGTILLNFAEVEYINSTGIALIVGTLAKARRDGLRVLSAGLSDHYREIFEITRLADFMELHPDEETAVALARTAEEAR